MASKNKKRLLFGLKILLATAVIGLLVGSGQLDFTRVAFAFRDGPAWIAMAAVCLLSTIFITSLRWQFLLKAQDLNITYWNTVRLTFVGGFFSTFMPGGTGGDIAKAYYVWDTGEKRTAAVTTVFLDRIVGLYAMLAFASAMALLQSKILWSIPEARPLLICVPSAFIIATICICIVFTPPVRSLLTTERNGLMGRVTQACNKIYDALLMYSNCKMAIVLALALSLISHVALSLAFHAFGQIFGEPIFGITRYFLIVPLGMIANGIPILPMGVGQGEAAFSFLYKMLLSSPVGAEATVLFRCLSIFWMSIGGLFYLSLKGSGFAQANSSARH